jgi:gp45 sliding clamp, C terminal
LTIGDSRSSVNYVLAAENLIVKPSDRNIEVPDDGAAHFELTNDDLQKLFKAMSILSLRELAIIGDGDLISIKGIDPEGKVQDSYSQVIGPNTNKFKAIIKLDNLKILPGDYSVKIARLANSVNVAHFKGRTEDVEYWISVSKDSQL